MKVNDDVDRLRSTGYVAEVFGVTAETVRNWIESGLLPATKINRQYRIKQSDIKKLAESKYGAGKEVTP